MSKIKAFALEKIVKWLLGGELFQGIKEIVDGLMDANIPSAEKRNLAFRKAQVIAAGAASFMVNLAIEAAVYILKAKQSSLEEK